MPKYRKKPVEVEAMQYDGSGKSFADICDAFPAMNAGRITAPLEAPMDIETRNGTVTVAPGDYVVQTVLGDYYPCKPDVFDATHELVEP